GTAVKCGRVGRCHPLSVTLHPKDEGFSAFKAVACCGLPAPSPQAAPNSMFTNTQVNNVNTRKPLWIRSI
ncbi:hypothetical protein ACFQZX_03325, partial [Mucilaginibacter litoreus]